MLSGWVCNKEIKVSGCIPKKIFSSSIMFLIYGSKNIRLLEWITIALYVWLYFPQYTNIKELAFDRKMNRFQSHNTNKYQNLPIKHIKYIRENYYMIDILKMYFSREYCFIPVSHKASMPWKAFRIKPGEQIIFSKIVTLHGINIYIELMRYVFLIRHTHAWV